MNKRVKYAILTLLALASFSGIGQKIPDVLEAKAEEQVNNTIAKLERQFSNIYTQTGETTFKFDTIALQRTRAMFYKYSDGAFTHISPNIMDPARVYNQSVFAKDTNILPKNFIVPIDQFLDSLVAWYCNDSCVTSLELNIINPKYDWDNYYYDPQLLCLKVYYTITVLGEPFIPRFNDILQDKSESEQGANDLDQYFEDEPEFTGQLFTRSTVVFLFKLENENIKESYIFKIYDDYIDNSIFVDDVRQIISERNKYYLSIKPYIGSSILKADFSDINNFKQIDEFQPYFGLHLDFNYYFNDGPRQFTKGLSVGAGWSRFNATGKVTDYSESFTEYSEPFKQDYQKFVYADNIQENLVLDYADINVLIKLRYRLYKNLELIGSIGPQASFLVNSSIEPRSGSNGYVNYQGLFSNIEFPDGTQGEFLLHDVPEYGFTTYTDLSFNDSEIGINTFNFCAYADIGLNLKMSHRFHMSFGIGYMYGFGNLVSDSSDEEFILSKGEGKVDNLFKNCTSLKIKAPSAFISASYLLNTKIK
jgi:hypothetical protein